MKNSLNVLTQDLPLPTLFARLNTKLRGYYHQVQRILFKALNRRSQRKSYNWQGFAALLEHYRLLQPRICQSV